MRSVHDLTLYLILQKIADVKVFGWKGKIILMRSFCTLQSHVNKRRIQTAEIAPRGRFQFHGNWFTSKANKKNQTKKKKKEKRGPWTTSLTSEPR